jgi:hypothetical protein
VVGAKKVLRMEEGGGRRNVESRGRENGKGEDEGTKTRMKRRTTQGSRLKRTVFGRRRRKRRTATRMRRRRARRTGR